MNFFNIAKNENATIFQINCETIDDNFMTVLNSKINLFSNIGLDMKNVKSINSKKFIESILNNKFKLFNLKNEVLIYLSLVIKNGYLKAFLNEQDFKENKREFIKRNFKIA